MKTIKTALAAASLAMIALASCKDDPKLPEGTEFHQIYVVEQYHGGTVDGTTNAFANLIPTVSKTPLELPKDCWIKVNDRQMMYHTPDPEDAEDYSYTEAVPGQPSKVTFTFHTPSGTLTNVCDMSNIPVLRFPITISKIVNGTHYSYPAIENPSVKVTIQLISINAETYLKRYDATILTDGDFYFTGVPAGKYVLQAIVSSTEVLQQRDGTAGGGSITGRNVSRIENLSVE